MNKQGKVPMYQVFVTDLELGHEIPIGPRMDDQKALFGLVESTNAAVATGRLHGWKDAHIVKFNP
jgi:hypothetical protein